MSVNPSLLLFGKDIKLSKWLGTIHQPTLAEILDKGLDVNDFISPFYLIVSASMREELDRPLLVLLAISAELSKQGKEPILDKLLTSLSMLYNNAEIQMYEMEDSIALGILDSDGIKYIIDDENFMELCEVVLEISNIDIVNEDADLDELDAPPEIIEKIREGRRKFREKERLEGKKKGLEFCDMCNELIHINNTYDYNSILNLTIWQIKNSYKILTVKNAQDSYINSGSVQWKAEDFPDWRKETKIKK